MRRLALVLNESNPPATTTTTRAADDQLGSRSAMFAEHTILSLHPLCEPFGVRHDVESLLPKCLRNIIFCSHYTRGASRAFIIMRI